jgi:membrane-associated phospholipid phosphatase
MTSIRHVTTVLVTAVVAAACADSISTSPGPAIHAPNTASLDAAASIHDDAGAPAVLGWNQTVRQLVVKYGNDPLVATRVYALVSAAQYLGVMDVPASDGRSSYEAERGAIAGASAAVLTFLYPLEGVTLAAIVSAQGGNGPGQVHPHFTHGAAAGAAAAQQVLKRAATDGFDAVWTGQVPVGDGLWVSIGPPPARPLLGLARPYFLTAGNQFRPGPPPAFGSQVFKDALKEVSDISVARTPGQLAIAQFWALRSGTVTTQGYWQQRAAELIAAAGLGEREATRILALVDAAALDAGIACWDAKYTYWFLRPSHATKGANLPDITLPIGLPSHPSYPSGHSCVSGASSEILSELFPSHEAALRTAAVEAGRSRVFAGIHYQFDADAGLALGRTVGRHAMEVERTRGLLAVLR